MTCSTCRREKKEKKEKIGPILRVHLIQIFALFCRGMFIIQRVHYHIHAWLPNHLHYWGGGGGEGFNANGALNYLNECNALISQVH